MDKKKTTTKPKFQFTLPRGERLISREICPYCMRFNSRSHAGSDGRKPR